MFQQKGKKKRNKNAEQSDTETEEYHFGVPCLKEICCGKVTEQKCRKGGLKNEFIQTTDKCIVKKAGSAKKAAQHESKKNGNGGIQAKNKIFHSMYNLSDRIWNHYKPFCVIVKWWFLCYAENYLKYKRRTTGGGRDEIRKDQNPGWKPGIREAYDDK